MTLVVTCTAHLKTMETITLYLRACCNYIVAVVLVSDSIGYISSLLLISIFMRHHVCIYLHM